ncbi:nicotinamide N-methyltransferase [Emydomyces testavorans]|uniref:Nicotinamide N-methyltransferase n=1 Tax=Emydomyces testavorans TaxID=2070801 RepID=A0AAF0IK05_9EURO|nr:nicotinamide N-methyltransferase [Emydomyces testavorans]
MLPSRIQPLHPRNPSSSSSSEDLLSSFLPHLYPDETSSCHGIPGQILLYASPLFGTIRIPVPDYAATSEKRDHDHSDDNDDEGVIGNTRQVGDVEVGRRLFAHYLWGGALVVAERIEEAERLRREEEEEDVRVGRTWSVRGQKVLEVGAGAALPSVIAALAGADIISITDHPSSAALRGAIQSCIAQNVSQETVRARISVHPHEWGVFFENSSKRGSGETENVGGKVIKFAADNKGTFTRIICADCLWIKDQHEHLVRSLLWFLKAPNKGSRGSEAATQDDGEYGIAWVVAGFHTGREIVASFFETAVSMGLVVEDIYERDINATSEMGEVTREWMPVREGEGPENRARWCVVAVLRKGVNDAQLS